MEEEEKVRNGGTKKEKKERKRREKGEEKTVPTNWMPLGKSTIPDNPITHRMERQEIQERERRKTGKKPDKGET